jgi:hypothetical protein
VLLAWWFATWGYGTPATVIGPFADQVARETVMVRIGQHGRAVTWCWWDGKP